MRAWVRVLPGVIFALVVVLACRAGDESAPEEKPGSAAQVSRDGGGGETSRAATKGLPEESSAVAWVDGQAITTDMLPPQRSVDSLRERRRRVDDAIELTLAAEEARRRGLQSVPRVRTRLEGIRREAELRQREVLANALFAEIAMENAPPDEVLKAHFEEAPERFSRKQVTLRLSRYPARDAAEAARALLSRGESLPGTIFEDVGPAFEWELPGFLRGRIDELGVPDTRLIVADGDVWVLVEVADARLVPPASYEAVREDVLRDLTDQRGGGAVAEALQALRQEHDVRINEEALSDQALW